MTHAITGPNVKIIPPPLISVTAPLPLLPHREEVRRQQGDCGTSAVSFWEWSGADSTFIYQFSVLQEVHILSVILL